MDFKLVSIFFARTLSALVLASLILTGQGVRPAVAAGYTVNTLSDNTTDDSFCTLREAILAANNTPSNDDCSAGSPTNDIITFTVSGTITLGSTLPNIVDAATAGTLTIDGGNSITISGNNNVQVMIVDINANLTLQNLTIANGNSNVNSGGVYNQGTLTITNSTFSNNNAHSGGGVYNYGGMLTITHSTFYANHATHDGGGVHNYGGNLTITLSTFYANSANYSGGGMYNQGTLTVANSTISNNSSASGNGGGVYNSSGTLMVTNSTLSANSATSGGGVYISGGTVTLKNTIIANSLSGGDCVGTLSGLNTANLIESSSYACGLTHNTNGNIIGFDPNLGALIGSPAYYPLKPGSLAIDSGNNTTCANPPVNNQSQNSVIRPQDGDDDGNVICDIGSYEAYIPVLTFLPFIAK